MSGTYTQAADRPSSSRAGRRNARLGLATAISLEEAAGLTQAAADSVGPSLYLDEALEAAALTAREEAEAAGAVAAIELPFGSPFA